MAEHELSQELTQEFSTQVLGDQTAEEVARELFEFSHDHKVLDSLEFFDEDGKPVEVQGWAVKLDTGVEIFPDQEALFSDLSARGVDLRKTAVRRLGPQQTLIL